MVVLAEKHTFCRRFGPYPYEGMPTRSAQIDADLALVREIIKFPPSERLALIGLLHMRQSHQQQADRDGIRPATSRQRLWRARKRAARHGVEIPSLRRGVKRTLAEAGRLARK